MQARQIGSFVPQDAAGIVHSVHDHALNIRVDGHARLISLIDRPEDLTGLSVLTDRLPPSPGRGLPCRLSDLVTWNPGVPRFAGMIEPRRALSRLSRAARLSLCLDALAHVGSPAGLLPIVLPVMPSTPFSRSAASALSEPAAAGTGELLSRLVGLGAGLTPSGDDFITGALTARAALPHLPEIRTAMIRRRLGRTTPAGATLLWLAVQGSFPAYLVRFVADVFGRTGDEDEDAGERDISRAVEVAASHGATSGTDAIAGFIWLAGRGEPGRSPAA